MKVQEIMTKDPAYCVPETPLKDVALLMIQHDCGEIPVVENEETLRPVGVVTDRDITCRIVAQGKNPLEMTAKDCMTHPCVSATPEMTLEECLALLERHQIRRLPVVNREGKCCGIVAQADIAKFAPEKETGELVKEVSQSTR